MRQLFVPACLCLMTLSNSTGFDLPLENMQKLEKRAHARAHNDVNELPPAGVTTAQAEVDIPAEPTRPAALEDSAIGDLSSIDPAAIPLPPIPKPVVPRSREEICQTLSEAAQSNELPLPFFIRLLFQESRFRSEAVSAAGAQGIAQFMPETSNDEGVENPFDPVQAIPASARLLRKLIAQFGNVGLAAAAYNAGPKRIQDWLEKKGDLPQETQGYVKNITGRPAETWKVASASGTALTLPYRAPCKEMVLPLPQPAPRPRTVTASAEPAKASATKKRDAETKRDASAKKPAPSNMKTVASATPKTGVKIQKATKPAVRPRPKTATQQLAARQHERGADKVEKLAQK